ncbi:MAG: helix-turn-helix domain-containing protein [Sodaliphilus sp.]
MNINGLQTRSISKPVLEMENADTWFCEATAIDCGMIVMCHDGEATLEVNFVQWQLEKGAVIMLFPNDVVVATHKSRHFSIEVLKFGAAQLREASMQLEQTVYLQLKADRCRTSSPIPTRIISNMFSLLRVYFEQSDCICIEPLVTLQLKAFFLGFYDYLYRNPQKQQTEVGSPRVRELFNRFMRALVSRYRNSRDVSYYADLLNVSPKYLGIVTRRVTGLSTKNLIDNYVVLQIKQSLATEEKSIKEIAWDYHFCDLSFFCRYFKQHTGLTPQQFRRQ